MRKQSRRPSKNLRFVALHVDLQEVRRPSQPVDLGVDGAHFERRVQAPFRRTSEVGETCRVQRPMHFATPVAERNFPNQYAPLKLVEAGVLANDVRRSRDRLEGDRLLLLSTQREDRREKPEVRPYVEKQRMRRYQVSKLPHLVRAGWIRPELEEGCLASRRHQPHPGSTHRGKHDCAVRHRLQSRPVSARFVAQTMKQGANWRLGEFRHPPADEVEQRSFHGPPPGSPLYVPLSSRDVRRRA